MSMIRIALLVLLVLGCFHMPTQFESAFTELANLRENSYRSLFLGVAALTLSRTFVGFGIALVELTLIACNLYIAYWWQNPGAIFIAEHYTTLQFVAYIVELLIMSIGILFEAARSGADTFGSRNWHLPGAADSGDRSVRR
jgi:hypothetical protein